ncbi:NAD(P)H nitroreductase [Mycobacterium antarcticum]|uniref:Acg family FMN-binding oxidoreductase n=1 Tax=Mycolicibacterium sp. TUM20985 TaxID=3023370 RepID=UPI0025731A59|nr:nitroreductase family protein [Mycolicibacterium sp. TUM20985]BDX33554.1 NAD(P)H nitroreductase [Mycolicibacterium sp. TUM20985]
MTRTTVDTRIVTQAIRLACRAPSLHNSQPWRWIVDDVAVSLYADYRRVVRSADRSGREAIISCGAALDHLLVLMTVAGWTTTVASFPDPDERDHLACLDFSPAELEATAAERSRAEAVACRRTNRLPFRAPRDWDRVEHMLRESVDRSTVTIDVLADDARPALAAASRRTEASRRTDRYYHDELRWWTDPLRSYEGVPPSALVSEDERDRVDINREFPVARSSDTRCDVAVDEAKVLVLSTPGDTREDALACGRALSTVLLGCTAAGVATCTLSHITEFASSRAVIRDLTGGQGCPQVLIRVGDAPVPDRVPAPTPRRPLSEVMQSRH